LRNLILVFLLLYCSQLSAQEYVISLQRWGVKEGLSHGQVNCIVKDDRGFIWLGTKYGLNRFDGYDFTTYTREKNGLPFNDIANIAVDAEGLLWLMGRAPNHNLVVFDPVKAEVLSLEKEPGFRTSQVSYLESGPDGTIYTGLSGDTSFFSYDRKQGWQKIALPRAMVPDHTLSRNVFITNKGSICMIKNKRLLYEWNVKQQILKQTIFPVDLADFTHSTPDGGIYFTGNEASYYLSPSGELRDLNRNAPPHDYSAGDFFFSTNIDGIMWRQGKLYHPTAGILRDFGKEGMFDLKQYLRKIIQDRDGRFWLCSETGLSLLSISRNKFRGYFVKPENSGGSSYRSMVIDNGTLYACNENVGWLSTRIVPEGAPATLLTIGPNKSVANIKMVRTNDNYLLGACNHGFYHASLPIVSGDLRVMPMKRPLFEESTWEMREISRDRYLLGTGNGLSWLILKDMHLEPFVQYNSYDELKTATVLCILPDSTGQLWVCSNTGLYTYDTINGVTGRYSAADTGVHYLPGWEYQHFYDDGQGVFWIGTAEGLVKWNKKDHRYQLFTRADGLSNNNIYAVYADEFGMLWLSSDYGIMRFDKRTCRVKTYLETEGITNNEFNRVSHYRDRDGTIYFGSMNGITSFHPRSFVNGSPGVQRRHVIAVTSFQQFSGDENRLKDKTAELIESNSVTVKPADQFLKLDFALLNFEDAVQTLYYWKIDGIDSTWNMQKERSVRFGRLPYGNWVLHVKAQASDGAWSVNELEVRLKVLKPYYLRWWFIAVCCAIVLIIVVSWNRWRVYRLNLENERLDRTVQEKTRSLEVALQEKEVLMKEIHHRVKNNLQVISGLLQLQSYSIEDERAKLALTESQNRVLSIALIHQKLYQNEHLDAVEFSSFADELFGQLNGIFAHPQKVVFDNLLVGSYLGIDVAVPLGLILNELMTNSFKYAFHGNEQPVIRLQLLEADKHLLLQYDDNGPGLPASIDPAKAKSLGIKLISRLSVQLEGRSEYQYQDQLSTFRIYFTV
jgi:two-component sensor histidine kinase/sugar lactone lactonase YvrE